MTASTASSRRHAIYSGQVQGVGFRATVCKIAQGYAVVGFVRNLRNGSVELVAEGPEADLDPFLAAISQRLSGNIDHIDVHPLPATGEFRSFGIAY